MSRTASRPRDTRGSALVEFTWLALILMVPLVYVVLAVFEVQRTSFAAATAARSAGRAYVTALGEGQAPRRAEVAARLALRDQGVDDARVGFACRPRPRNCLAPGSTVEVTVRSQVRLPLVPKVIGDRRPSIRVTARHAAPYGTFREDR